MKTTASILAWVALIAFVAGIVFAVPVFGRLSDPFDSKFEYVGGDAYNLINASVQASVFAILSIGSFIMCLISAAFSALLGGISDAKIKGEEKRKLMTVADYLIEELDERFSEREAKKRAENQKDIL
jgi:MFS family permease